MAIAAEPRPAYGFFSRVQHALGVATIESDADMLRLVESRMPVTVIGALMRAGLTADEVYTLILPQRTLSHRKIKSESLTPDESDRALRIARTIALTEVVFGDHDKAMRWLRKSKSRFGSRAPLAMLATETGGRLVEEMLYQIDYGMLA